MTAADRPRPIAARLPALVHAGSLAVAAVVLLFASRGQWFFGDEWDFLTDRGLEGAHFGLWTPHNEHWSTWPILVYRALFGVFGLRTYWPYVAVLAFVHLATVHLVWRVARRAGAAEFAAAGIAFVFAVHGAGAENLLWAFQIGFVGSLGAAYVLLLVVDSPHLDLRRATYAAALGVLALPVSGISVLAVFAAALLAFVRRGWLVAAVVAGPPAVVYMVWLRLFGSESLDGGYRGSLADVPSYAWRGLSGTVGALVGVPGLGGPLFVALTAYGVWLVARHPSRAAPAAVAATTAVVLFVVVGSGRGALAVPTSSRYLYLTAGLLVPLAAAAVTDLARLHVATRFVPLLLVAVMTGVGVNRLFDDAVEQKTRELAIQRQLFAALERSVAGAPVDADVMPEATYSPNLTLGELVSLDRRGELPAAPPIGPIDRLSAAAHLDVTVAPDPSSRSPLPASRMAPAARVLGASGGSVEVGDDGCVRIDSDTGVQVALGYDGRAELRISNRKLSEIAVFLQDRPGGHTGAPRIFRTLPRATTLVIAAADAHVALVGVPAGKTTMCGVARP